ncbi:MAG: hypothetical protein WCI36_02740 [bacterium]
MNSEIEKKEVIEGDFDVESMYTTLSEAKAEVWRRWNDKELRKKVEEYLGEIPDVFKAEPRAVLARHVTTPNLELGLFLEMSKMAELKPVNLEYIKDKFRISNFDKRYIAKMPFVKRNEYGGEKDVRFMDSISFDEFEGVCFDKISTIWGEKFVCFHHRLLNCDEKDIDICDISDWYELKGGFAHSYMKYFMSLFLCNGILFENYLIGTTDEEKYFTQNVVYKNFKKIENKFGIKPLIVRLIPSNEELDLYWWSYSNDLEKNIYV